MMPSRPLRWLLPHPVLSLLLAACWLVLQRSPGPGQWVLAALLGVAIPHLLRRFVAPGLHVRRWRGVPRLVLRVAWDIARANVAVAAIVLDPRSRPRPAWVRVPIALEPPGAVVLLAAIVTSTPGTVSARWDEARRELLVHALHCDDPDALVRDIQARYEVPLKEIFS